MALLFKVKNVEGEALASPDSSGGLMKIFSFEKVEYNAPLLLLLLEFCSLLVSFNSDLNSDLELILPFRFEFDGRILQILFIST